MTDDENLGYHGPKARDRKPMTLLTQMREAGEAMVNLNSPTCRDCARSKGYIPLTDIFTVYEGVCLNCNETKTVSSASDWRKPGERVHAEAWD